MTLQDEALRYHALGWPVLPVEPRGKKPVLRNWPELAPRFTADNITQMWGTVPAFNIGLATGHVFDVLDLDGDEGTASLNDYLARRGIREYHHPGPLVRTGGGGWHLYFAATGERNGTHILPGVDFRGTGGMVVAPPSIHASGATYEWIRGPVNALPTSTSWLVALVAHAVVGVEVSPQRPRLHSNAGHVLDALRAAGFALVRDGANRWATRCNTGLHRDSEPSLKVYPATESWYCFGCGASGDAQNIVDGTYVLNRTRRATAK